MISKPLTAADPAGMCAQLRVNGRVFKDAAAIQPPNVIRYFVRKPGRRDFQVRKDGAIREATMRASSVDVFFDHPPCHRCAEYRSVEL